MCTIYTICPFPPICCLPYGIQTYWVGFCILKNITQIYVICCSFYSTVIEQKNVAFQQKSKRTLPIDPRLHVQHPSENVIDYPTRPLRAVGWQCWGERTAGHDQHAQRSQPTTMVYSEDSFMRNSFEIPPDVMLCWIGREIQADGT